MNNRIPKVPLAPPLRTSRSGRRPTLQSLADRPFQALEGRPPCRPDGGCKRLPGQSGRGTGHHVLRWLLVAGLLWTTAFWCIEWGRAEPPEPIKVVLLHTNDLALTEQFGQVDVIIDGHSHTHVNPAIVTNGVLVAQTRGHRHVIDAQRPQQLGVIRLILENGKVVQNSGEVLTFDGR